jgi:hypothetical protein
MGGDAVAGQIDPRCRHCRGGQAAHPVIAAEARELSGWRIAGTAATHADIHPGFSVRQGDDVELGPLGRAERPDRRHDLLPAVTGIQRPPDPPGEERRVHRIRVGRIEHHAPRPSGRARRLVHRDLIRRRREAQRRGDLVYEVPARAPVDGSIETEVRRARDERVCAAAARVRDAQDAAARSRKDHVRVARLHGD